MFLTGVLGPDMEKMEKLSIFFILVLETGDSVRWTRDSGHHYILHCIADRLGRDPMETTV